jgi:hypothetical protein
MNRYRPLVFICSPFAGEVKRNLENARRYCRFAVDRGAIPFAPHLLYPQFMDDGNPDERELALSFGLRLLYGCEEVWIFGSQLSRGMRLEIHDAKRRGLLMRHFNEHLEEILHE